LSRFESRKYIHPKQLKTDQSKSRKINNRKGDFERLGGRGNDKKFVPSLQEQSYFFYFIIFIVTNIGRRGFHIFFKGQIKPNPGMCPPD
jgi:hypothetical protein